MRRPLAPLRTTAALALSLSLALTACGSDDSDPDASKDDSTSASSQGENDDTQGKGADDSGSEDDNTSGGGNSSGENSGGGDVPQGDAEAGGELTVEEFASLLATAMQRGKTARISTSGTGLAGSTTEGVVDYTRDEPAMRMSTDLGGPNGGSSEVIMVDGDMYMQMGDDGMYIKMNRDTAGVDTSQLDPSSTFGSFAKAIKKLTYVGQEKLNGDDTHHYVAEIDTKKLSNDMAGDAPKSLDYHVWFDDKSLVRQFSVDMGSGLGEMVMNYSDWGKPVQISAPPKDKVTEMPTLPSAPSN